jgi:chromosome partitioning protein
MRILAVVNQKGGSGKTTTAVNLAAALAEKGQRVLLIDMDPQASSSHWLGLKEKGRALFEMMTSERSLESSVEKTEYNGLSMIPSSPILAGVEKILATEVAAESVLKNKFQVAGEKPWDFVLIDCPPTLGVLAINALTFAHEVLIPVETHVMALAGLVQLLKTVQLVRERLNPTLQIAGILPCRVDFRTKHSKDVVSQLKARFEGKIFQAAIRENVRLAEAPLHQKPINHFDPSCNGTKDYQALAAELLVPKPLPSS